MRWSISAAAATDSPPSLITTHHLRRHRAGILIDGLALPKERATVARSLAGHIVAGVASEEEVKAFEKFCAGLG
jgi:hypothetical protein